MSPKEDHISLRVGGIVSEALDELAKMEDTSRTRIIESAICSYIKQRVRNDCAAVMAPFHRLENLDQVAETFLIWLQAKREQGGYTFSILPDFVDIDGNSVPVLLDGNDQLVNAPTVTEFRIEHSAMKAMALARNTAKTNKK